MRCQKLYLDATPRVFIYANKKNRIFQCLNGSVANIIYLQFGEAPGAQADAYPIGAGQVYTLDPAAPVDRLWMWTDLPGIANSTIIG